METNKGWWHRQTGTGKTKAKHRETQHTPDTKWIKVSLRTKITKNEIKSKLKLNRNIYST